ncbi:diphosphate--fructose-6-phosphate 1-phosphotransferase [bacterium]|nr:diphosphate--fructose-6-phosphate 1-phosphotransferase [bacterium]
MTISELQKARLNYQPQLAPALQNGASVKIIEGKPTTSAGDSAKIKTLFPKTYGSPILEMEIETDEQPQNAINVGVILSGGQAPGGHNVIAGLFDGLQSLDENSKLFGFLGGPDGLIEGDFVEITEEFLVPYRNTGGFDIIGSGRTKLEDENQFHKVAEHCEKLNISALVIIGGDDSNTNASLLAEFYAQNGIPIQVIGVPKTIDGDLKNEQIEISFGFDTACKVYSGLIGNIMRDVFSAKKYWHFIRLMGRSASHITLECALQTQPNIAIISEEVAEKRKTLGQIIEEIAEIVKNRAQNGENFGVALIPEGLVEFIPEFKMMIAEMNDLIANEAQEFNNRENLDEKTEFIAQRLKTDSQKLYKSLPNLIQKQLVNDRDPHGNVQVSLIETEKLLIEMVNTKLKSNGFSGKFKTQSHFFGYEGRSVFPSNFDANYTYNLGFTASALICAKQTGYMAAVRNLAKPVLEWQVGGVPIPMMMNIERRHGSEKPVIAKALTELDSVPFVKFVKNREKWANGNYYIYPGPVQYFGPTEVCDRISEMLKCCH